MALPDRDLQAAIAATRFGLGARPGEIAEARRDPQGFLSAQIRPSRDRPAHVLPKDRVLALKAFREVQSEFTAANRARAPGADDLRQTLNARRRALRDGFEADILQRAI